MPEAVTQPPPAMSVSHQERPIGVTIIGILWLIGAAFFLMFALFFLAAGGFAATFVDNFAEAAPGFLAPLIAIGGILIGLFFGVFGALFLLVGIGLFKGQGWAWILTIVLEVLSILGNLTSLFDMDAFGGAVISIAIAALIIWYFFTEPVKAFFGKGNVNTPWAKKPAQGP